jgi:uncharacterized protein YjbI with pentapeptide repeats
MIIDRISQFLAEYAAGKRDFRGANLAYAYLAGANLEGANLEGADLSSRANLSRANLAGANLSGANLKNADLEGAYLARADLSGANLYSANLAGANLSRANLSGANLAFAYLTYANLEGANLAGAKLVGANLVGANLSRATGLPEIEPFPIDTGIAEAVADGTHLDMSTWHNSCGTAHCRAGWAVTLHPQGKKLEVEFGTNAAAALIYNACSISERTPDWFASNADALADIRRLAELASKVVATPDDVKGTP